MKAYIVNFNPFAIQPQELLNYFDTESSAIRNWYSPFAGTIIIASENTQTELSNLVSSRFPLQHFMIAEVNVYSADGRMPSTAWDFIKEPKSSGRWEYNLSNILGGLGNMGGLTSTGGLSGHYDNALGFRPPSSPPLSSLADLLYDQTKNKK